MIQIVVACHKPCTFPESEMYIPLHVGSAGKKEMPGFRRDDEGDSISEKNPLYCELTGLYWAWKNLEFDYLGLVHYRRLFLGADKKVLTDVELERIMEKHQIILPRKRHYYIESIYSHYKHTHDEKHLQETRTVVEETQPEYLSSFDSFMKQTSGYMFNMFVMPKTIVDSYCTWLFAVLRNLEDRIDTNDMTPYEKRYIGRIGELLLNVWLIKQLEKGIISTSELIELPYSIEGDVDWKRKIISFLSAKFLKKKYDRSF